MRGGEGDLASSEQQQVRLGDAGQSHRARAVERNTCKEDHETSRKHGSFD